MLSCSCLTDWLLSLTPLLSSNATVRASSDQVELFVLSKKDFFTNVDSLTLAKIIDQAAIKAACAKEPDERTNDDIRDLMRHTTFLSKRFPEPVHRALCKAFHFQKVPVGESITSEGTPAGSLYFIASGRVSSFSRQSRRRTLVAAGMWHIAAGATCRHAAVASHHCRISTTSTRV